MKRHDEDSVRISMMHGEVIKKIHEHFSVDVTGAALAEGITHRPTGEEVSVLLVRFGERPWRLYVLFTDVGDRYIKTGYAEVEDDDIVQSKIMENSDNGDYLIDPDVFMNIVRTTAREDLCEPKERDPEKAQDDPRGSEPGKFQDIHLN